MFFSLQIIWYPIEALTNLLLRVFRYRTRGSHKDTDLESSTGIDLGSTGTTAKQDAFHIDVIEVREDCDSTRTEFHEGGMKPNEAQYVQH
ncbi:hypothetical protein N7478_008396 [Penicillium angulare]|uniref:uncharacterized protein n=1 Tax=Penicillium angulare TaxID=116970 RepID=UPI002541FE68|nr:uncharacterized protein N7478_008396 [Penicillium angulare]KAJ5273271.1 hypothetical protein N7478_008396 [Penicillium angulare]